jgi:hypothetical protein
MDNRGDEKTMESIEWEDVYAGYVIKDGHVYYVGPSSQMYRVF